MKLSEWENRLHQEFERIELIGELEVSETQIAELSPQIKNHIDVYGPKVGLGVLLRKYHRTWMTYLVFQGVYGYSDGDYWTSIADSVGIDSRNALSVWGRLFFLSLERFSLPTFPGVEGNRYVMRILLHGGIPQSALPNFFEHFLAHLTAHPELAGLGPDDLIEYALTNTSAQYGLTKPVQRFLANGGRIAADFVARCLDLATVHAATGKVPSGKQVGLPERIVSAYLAWYQDRSLPVRRMITRLQRPQIVFDAYGDGITAVLPGQSLENLAVRPQAGWTVSYGDTSLRQWVPVYRRTDGWQTKEDSVVLSSPFSECRITFDDDRELAQTWQFGGLDSRRPLILFDAATGRIKSWSEDVPAGQYWLMFPKTYSLSIPNGVSREEAGTLPWDWGSYRAQLWDLSAAKAIELRETSKGGRGQLIIIRVAADAADLRPWLVGGEIAVACRTGVGSGTVYAGELPRICIPVSPQRTADTELLRWRIFVIEAGSEQQREMALDQTCKGIKSAGSRVEIDLVAAGLVPAEPFGAFEVQLRGPLGRDMTFVLVSVPGLQIGGNDRVRVARPDGLLPQARLEISCANWIEVDSLQAEVGVEQVNAGAHVVHVPAERSEVELRLTSTSASAAKVGADVYIQVPAPVLQWTLVDGKQFGGKVDWRTTAVIQAKTWLEQSQQPQLIASISPPAATQDPVRGTLAVAYTQFGAPQIVEPQFSTSRFLRFDLRGLRDSVRSSKLLRIQCALELQSLGGYSCEVSVPSVFFTQVIQFNDVTLTSMQFDDAWQLDVSWDASAILVGRCVRLWSLSRPWQPPLDLRIPDDAAVQCAWQVATNELPPGNYRLQIIVLDAWLPGESTRPAKECPNCVDVVLGSAADLEVYIEQLPQTFVGFLERLLLAASGAARISAMQQMTEHFEETDAPLALDVLLQLAEEWGTERLFSPENRNLIELLQVLLLDPPNQLLQTVAERVAGMDLSQQGALRKLLIALGIMSYRLAPDQWRHELTAPQLGLIWQFWPALGTILERSPLVQGEPNACSRARHRLGLDTLVPLHRSIESTNHVDDDDGKELEPQHPTVAFPGVQALSKLCGGAPEDALLSMPADRLREVARELNIVPSGLLAEDQWLGANLAWLIDLRADPSKERAAAAWLQRNTEWLYSSIEALGEESRVPPELLALANRRIPHTDLHPLAVLPYAVGATALILRLLANDPQATRILRGRRHELDLVGLKLMEFAPDLLERDLCIVELSLAQLVLYEDPL